ncbi:hypothetical protein BVC80_1583g28 [Macleaya cordata]|uniref:RNA recognition motif domain n=1 Tax=Macleaya cordata TaxID=56857 RepID=A0A200QLC1_MACCD|nr:hypothetical protein BVC80_1583g28 [Macleaya cordata]
MRVLGVETFQPTCNSSSALTTIPLNPITFSLLLPNRTHKFLKTNFSSSLSIYTNASSNVQFSQGRTGFSVHATKKRSKDSPSEMEGFDDDDDEEEEGMFIPFEGMRRWAQNKPPGFGVGKEYDTSIEDKLVEEIEQSRRAQLANINKLKNNSPKTSSQDKQKAPEVVPSGIRVRVANLPKKKNIHRDLQLAFKGFPGIINISPAVSGNKKTREPICKGFAFVYLRSEDVANRFVQTYSRQSIAFGKIQKQVTCEMTNPRESSDSELAAEGSYISNPAFGKIQKQMTHEMTNPRESSDSTFELAAEGRNISNPAFGKIQKQVTHEMTNPGESSDSTSNLAAEGSFISNPELKITSLKENLDTDFDDSSDTSEVTSINESIDLDDQSVSANWEEVEEGIEHLSLLEPNDDGNPRPRLVTKTDSLPSKQPPKSQKVQKKLIIKGKKEKVPKSNVPGSAKRLKIKEKAVLAGVLSRYGAEASLASRKES